MSVIFEHVMQDPCRKGTGKKKVRLKLRLEKNWVKDIVSNSHRNTLTS